MRRLNRSSVLDLLRSASPLSRAEMARRLGMSMPTVARIVDELQAEGFVRADGRDSGRLGRPSELLSFNGAAHAVLGLDLGGESLFGAVADLAGAVQHEFYAARGRDAAENLQCVFGLIERLLAAPRPQGQRLRGIGLGVPGTVLHREGQVVWAPSLRWRDLALRGPLEDRYRLPVSVENDVNLAALGELGFGAGRGLRDLVCLTVGTGVGAGVVIGGALYRGHRQAAGEVGYLVPGVALLGRPCPAFGHLESLASADGVVARARAAGAERTDLTVDDVWTAARAGEGWALAAVDETAAYLSLAIAAINTLLDPEAIILGGGAQAAADLLLPRILERLQGLAPYPPRLIASTLGYRAAAMGAVMLVLDATTERVVVEQRT